MGLKIKKIDRLLSKSNSAEIVDLTPGWKFSITSKAYETVAFDFRPFRDNGREKLAEQIRDAFWSLRHESQAASLSSYFLSITRFWKFLDYDSSRNASITNLREIDKACLERYLAWLSIQIVPTRQKNSGKPLSRSSARNSYNGLKSLLINRQRLAPFDVSSDMSFPKNPFPNFKNSTTSREPFSKTEHRRILDALNHDLKSFHSNDSLTELQVLTIHLLVLAVATGANLQPLLELRRGDLAEHPLPDRELLLTTKRRGRTTFAASVRKTQSDNEREIPYTIPATVGDHFRALCEYTSSLTSERRELAEYAFLWRVSRGPRKNSVVRLTRLEVKAGITRFASRHKLVDDYGDPLSLSFARFRPTFATELYRRTRDIRTVSRALGHASPETTAKSYAKLPVDAERNHALVAEAMVSKFAQGVVNGKILIAADGAIPLATPGELLPGGYNTGIARCANPFRDEDAVCKKFLTCFRCPNMMVFEDDLWRLYSFYYRLLSERTKMRSVHWMKTYAPIIRRVDEDISPLFPVDVVEAARTKARNDPHPTWRAPTL